MAGAFAAILPDGRRLHLQHGPIDLIVEAFGEPGEIARAYEQAVAAFGPVLPGLVAELPILRRPVEPDGDPVRGPVACRMVAAVRPFRDVFVTPMAAVAGAVADHMLQALVEGRRLSRAYVNNGGDIALYLTPGTRFEIGVVSRIDRPGLDGKATVAADQPIRGIATSGCKGRSFSLGIADAVTVLAATASEADAAATLIANAVDIDHPAIARQTAVSLDPDSDLGDRLVTVSVGALDEASIAAALDNGCAAAQRMLTDGRVAAAFLSVQHRHRVVGGPLLGAVRVEAPPHPAAALPPSPTRGEG